MRAFQVIVIVFILTAARVAVAADTVPPQNDHQFAHHSCCAAGSIPTRNFSGAGPGGSAFLGTETALAAGARGGRYSLGVAAEAATIDYANPRLRRRGAAR